MKIKIEKYIYVNKNEFKASVKHVGGVLQIADLTAYGQTSKKLEDNLRNGLNVVNKVLNEHNAVEEETQETPSETLSKVREIKVKN